MLTEKFDRTAYAKEEIGRIANSLGLDNYPSVSEPRRLRDFLAASLPKLLDELKKLRVNIIDVRLVNAGGLARLFNNCCFLDLPDCKKCPLKINPPIHGDNCRLSIGTASLRGVNGVSLEDAIRGILNSLIEE